MTQLTILPSKKASLSGLLRCHTILAFSLSPWHHGLSFVLFFLAQHAAIEVSQGFLLGSLLCSIYLASWRTSSSPLALKRLHLYADDLPIFIPIPDISPELQTHLFICLLTISTWMLKGIVNVDSPTEPLIFSKSPPASYPIFPASKYSTIVGLDA